MTTCDTTTINTGNQQCLISGQYAQWANFFTTLPERFDHEGTIIYAQRNTIRTMPAPCGGASICVKRYCRPTGINRPVYSLGIRESKGQRAFSYPTLLLSRGIATPHPIALIEQREGAMLGYSYFVSEQCPYSHTLYEMKDTPRDLYIPVATQLAHFTAHMHEQRIMHKDYTPGNILWDYANDGSINFALVDTNRMHFGPVPPLMAARNMARLWGPREFTECLSAEYARCRHWAAEPFTALTLRARRLFWRRYALRHPLPVTIE